MSETPTIQALQAIYDEAQKAALAELGEGYNVVGVSQRSLTEYLAVARGMQLPAEFVQTKIVASCTVTCIDSLMRKTDITLELTFAGEWRVTETRKYTGAR